MAEAKGNISVAHISSSGAAQTLELRLRSKSETVAEGRGSRLDTAEDVGSVVLSLRLGGRGLHSEVPAGRGAATQPGICLPAWASTCFDTRDSRCAPSPASRPSPAALGPLCPDVFEVSPPECPAAMETPCSMAAARGLDPAVSWGGGSAGGADRGCLGQLRCLRLSEGRHRDVMLADALCKR